MWGVLVEDLEELGWVDLVLSASPDVLQEASVVHGHLATCAHRVGLVNRVLMDVSYEEISERLNSTQTLDSYTGLSRY